MPTVATFTPGFPSPDRRSVDHRRFFARSRLRASTPSPNADSIIRRHEPLHLALAVAQAVPFGRRRHRALGGRSTLWARARDTIHAADFQPAISRLPRSRGRLPHLSARLPPMPERTRAPHHGRLAPDPPRPAISEWYTLAPKPRSPTIELRRVRPPPRSRRLDVFSPGESRLSAASTQPRAALRTCIETRRPGRHRAGGIGRGCGERITLKWSFAVAAGVSPPCLRQATIGWAGRSIAYRNPPARVEERADAGRLRVGAMPSDRSPRTFPLPSRCRRARPRTWLHRPVLRRVKKTTLSPD